MAEISLVETPRFDLGSEIVFSKTSTSLASLFFGYLL
jgi:hypothetical protein